ncbi:hypothetical protein J6590_090351 [Homalodisca vitripennis]|nr:hypothetical protein J6590_090351 [Homalodisca vitripennis]
MPYYYVLPVVEDESKEVVYSDFRYEKPVAYNLLLPSIHSSRDDNVLLTEGDTQGAVTALLNSYRDSLSWPSSTFRHGVGLLDVSLLGYNACRIKDTVLD